MNVRSAGLKFKIANNFIWRVGHGVHHRDSTLPPCGWSSHEVNSERLFFSSIRRVKHRGLIRREKNHLLFFSRKSANRSVPCLLSQSPSPRTSTILSVPSRFSVFLPSRSPHASRGQTWSPRVSTTHSLPCRFSQSHQYVSLNPRANTTRFVPCLLSQNPQGEPFQDMFDLCLACSINGRSLIVFSNSSNFTSLFLSLFT